MALLLVFVGVVLALFVSKVAGIIVLVIVLVLFSFSKLRRSSQKL